MSNSPSSEPVEIPATETPTPCEYHRFYEPACMHCAAANGDGGPFLPSPIPAQCELVDKAALEALREAVKGCGENYIQELGCYGLRTLCAACQEKRDAAIAALLGDEESV